MNQQYTITNTLRTILFSMMGIGLLCLVLTWMGDDHSHTRFWSNVLHNSVFLQVLQSWLPSLCLPV